MRMWILPITSLLVLTVGCSGHSSTPTSSSEISGSYEFAVTSNVTGGTTLVEANMAGMGNQSSATGPNQVQVLTLEKKNWYVNGICAGPAPGQNSVDAGVSGSNVALMFNQGGNALPGQGVLTGTMITGNYLVTDSNCPDLVGTSFPPGSDSGGIVGNQVPDLAGTFSGPLSLNDGTNNAALMLSEGADNALTVSAQLRGPINNGTFTFTGSAVGNIMFVSGSVNGQSLSWFGYYDRTGTYTGTPFSMLVFDYNTQTKLGLLLSQLPISSKLQTN